VTDISATDAARRFAEILDGVEHRGESYTIVRRGRAVAHLEPLAVGGGDEVRRLLARHRPDRSWRSELEAMRALTTLDDRP
jgi:prevent-host-death family protein